MLAKNNGRTQPAKTVARKNTDICIPATDAILLAAALGNTGVRRSTIPLISGSDPVTRHAPDFTSNKFTLSFSPQRFRSRQKRQSQ